MLKELKDRLKAETPLFFLKLRALAIAIGSGATAMWVANSTMSLGLDPWILSVCKYSIAFCAAVGLSSSLTKTT